MTRVGLLQVGALLALVDPVRVELTPPLLGGGALPAELRAQAGEYITSTRRICQVVRVTLLTRPGTRKRCCGEAPGRF
jgi:hypothetical protein